MSVGKTIKICKINDMTINMNDESLIPDNNDSED